MQSATQFPVYNHAALKALVAGVVAAPTVGRSAARCATGSVPTSDEDNLCSPGLTNIQPVGKQERSRTKGEEGTVSSLCGGKKVIFLAL